MSQVANPIVVMKRYELKYILSPEQAAFFRERIKGHMEVDEFGKTSIASLYYDTPDYRLIRASIEKPPFKEKIRLRSYGLATDESPVFLELKRKTEGIVYKRRVSTTIPLVKRFFDGLGDICAGGQINREIVYFRDYYKTLVPACLIIYDRTAYFEPDGDLRLTIDEAPRYRTKDLDLKVSMDGTLLLPPGYSILEIKVQQAMPLWLTSILSEGKIYRASFSKYGAAYRQQILNAAQLNLQKG
ncbi:MAG: polyphosphate polymerase domain-containing protein [Lachnospiraceae bacterium]|nr:polyphosphate polymerase domain-containing protein [Lachnospiraceae bacterium]